MYIYQPTFLTPFQALEGLPHLWVKDGSPTCDSNNTGNSIIKRNNKHILF